MIITYKFFNYTYDFEVPFAAIQDIFKTDYPEVDDIIGWLQDDDNEQDFGDTYYGYLKEQFYNDAYNEAREELMDPYSYYGISRRDFY